MCLINKTGKKVDVKATEVDVADADKEKKKKNEKPAFFSIIGWNGNYKLQKEFLKKNS